MINFIAEVSSNHNQSLDRCLQFVDIASEIGCNSIKFQLFKVDQLFSHEVLSQSQTHRDRVNWELPFEFIPKIYERCQQKEISFSCTPFYLEAVDELLPYVDFFKVASYELLWDDLLIKCAQTGKPVIISTGMANLNEIKHAVNVLQSNGCHNPQILHCSSAYPTPIQSSNLSAIDSIRKHTGCEVGWSDHTVSDAVILNSILQWNASIVEFHLDLDGNGYEYSKDGHCWLPSAIKEVIQKVNLANISNGDGEKQPNPHELSDRNWRADPSDGLRPMLAIRNKLDLS
jgi:sialic acid synthase SpsE